MTFVRKTTRLVPSPSSKSCYKPVATIWLEALEKFLQVGVVDAALVHSARIDLLDAKLEVALAVIIHEMWESPSSMSILVR